MNLKNIEPNLINIISTMSNLTGLEYAIFDINSKLVTSTQSYLKTKGKNVHLNAIKEVVNQGNVIVDKPGNMVSCSGCRFVNNCPSTMEILSCIKLNGNPIGVLSVTSFSSQGHTMIENNISHYIELLDYISDLISMFAYNNSFKNQSQILHTSIDAITGELGKNFIVIDNNGLLLHWNKELQDFFPSCNLYALTINQVFPEDITDWLFSTKTYSQKKFSIEGIISIFYSNPIIVDDEVLGYVIRIDKDQQVNMVKLNNHYLDSIVTKDVEMNHIKERIMKVSNSPSSVFITGETGTGKEMIARAVHYTGNRKQNPFVPINCANIPESLFESELFGYESGSFTGAKKGGKIGMFESAHGGTLFLDEIGEMPMHLQSKLLRVLQENVIYRVGSITPIPIDVRVVTATNKDLELLIEKGDFREDLFYRINVIPIHLPPLNKRINDIEILARFFMEKYSSKLNNHISNISKEAINMLKSYLWPGNIRELENAIEYAVNMEETNTIQVENLPHRVINPTNNLINIKDFALQKETDLIVNGLNKNGWNLKGKEKTSEELGISVRTLYRKIKDIEQPQA